MKKAAVILLAIALGFAATLLACSPRFIGEAEAKEAGLALINQVFDTNQTEAEVVIEEAPAEKAGDEVEGQQSNHAPNTFYTISIKDGNTGEAAYSALVNAETGFAYYAFRRGSMLSSLTEEQLQQSEEMAKLPWNDASVTDTISESKPQAFVWEWAETHLNPGVPLRMVDVLGMEGNLDSTRRIDLGYYAVFEDGAVYDISLSWPTMEIQSVTILSQSIQ